MKLSSRPTRINIDLQEYKRPLLDYCKLHSVTPSEAFRQIIAKLTEPAGTPMPLELSANCAGKLRREIRLTRNELNQVEALAAREGFSPTRWIVALVRAHLSGQPQLGQYELELLARSNLQMLAIGRNLNQVARAMSTGGSVDLSAMQLVIELREAVTHHTERVAALVRENTARWKI